jgi:sugar (pentulose or hexulose) kinase
MQMTKSGPHIMVVDVGTSATKAGVYDLNGQELGAALVEYPLGHPRPNWAEQNANDWWKATVRSIKGALAQAQVRPEAIEVVSVSGQATSCLPIDHEGNPLRPAIIWIDRRATAEVEWLVEHIGAERIHRLSGNTIDGNFGGLKWLWFRNNEAELFSHTWKIMQANGYIIFKLTGAVVTDRSQAAMCAPFFDLQQKEWSREMCDALDFPLDLLPELAPSAEVVGQIQAEGAAATGLVAGTPIVAGAGDYACATLGCGVTEVGQVAQMLGTAGNFLIPMGDTIDPDPRLVNIMHLDGEYLTAGSIYAGGVLQWFRNELGQPEVIAGAQTGKSAYQLLDERAAKIAPGAEGLLLLPYFMGERAPLWDPYARGVYFGLSPYHTRAHMYRAALEGVAYGFRHMAEIIKLQGVKIQRVITGDGGAKSRIWRQIFADVLNARMDYYAGGSATLLGNVALAGVGVGLFDDLSVVKQWQVIVDSTEPDPARHELYTKYYEVYRQVYEQLKDQFKQLVTLGQLS